jgi:glycosyltransferase involved in cell wall biosynthesis
VVVAPGDSRRLAGVLRELKDNPAEVVKMGQAARAAYEQHYSLAEVATRYGALFTEFPGRSFF